MQHLNQLHQFKDRIIIEKETESGKNYIHSDHVTFR